MKLWEHTIGSAHDRLKNKEISAVELLQSVLDRIQEEEPSIHAYLSQFGDRAVQQAKRANERLAKGEDVTPLTGIPLGIKDVICIADHPTTCASKILETFRPPYHATVIERLENAGAVFVGKTNMDEFAMGSSTENSAFGATRNPWDLKRVPGGSSGGSAAAVAAGEALGSLGSDTGGSIRQPASLCGVVGFKPTYGLVSRFGLVAFASSLDQIGPMGRTVFDCHLIMDCIAGHDAKDSTSAKVRYQELTGYGDLARHEDGLKNMVIGIPREFFGEGLDPEVKTCIMEAGKHLQSMGARLEEVSFPSLDYALSAYYIISSAEASSNLARYDGTRYGLRVPGATAKEVFRRTRQAGFGPEVKRRIMLGTYALSSGYYDALYLKAQKIRTLLARDFEAAFKTCQVLLTPTSPFPAFKLGEKTADPLSMYLSDVCTIPVNLAGIPGLSVPAGFSSANLPIGAQFLAPAFHDCVLFRAGIALERALHLSNSLPGVNRGT